MPVGYPRMGVTALNGNRLPHNRPAQTVTGVNAVAALCYRSLF